MPQIIVKGLPQETVCAMSKLLLNDLAKINETPADYFLFQCDTNPIFIDGKPDAGYPLVEIKQFQRDKAMEEATAKLIIQYIKSLGYTEAEVYYIHLSEAAYYLG